jgi:hypothetical protein
MSGSLLRGGGAENNDVCGCVGMLLVSRFLYISSLRTLGSLHDLKLNHLSFLQGAITVSNNRGIMNEDVGTILAPNESVAFRVIEPFHRAAQTLTLPQQMFHFLVSARSLAERGRQSTTMCDYRIDYSKLSNYKSIYNLNRINFGVGRSLFAGSKGHKAQRLKARHNDPRIAVLTEPL